MKKDMMLWVAGRGFMSKKLSVPLILVLLIFSMVLNACNTTTASLEEVSSSKTLEVSSTAVVETPIETSTLIPTETPAPTQTPTQTPTPTIVPTIMTEEQFLSFMHNVGEILLMFGYHYYDGYDLFSNYPYYPVGNVRMDLSLVDEVYLEAYKENNQLEFWCGWVRDGLIEDFVYPAGHAYKRVWWDSKARPFLGNPNGELYCSDFDMGFDDFVKLVRKGVFGPLPQQEVGGSLDWNEEQRLYVEEQFSLMASAIVWTPVKTTASYFSSGKRLYYPGLNQDMTYSGWSQSDLTKLTDKDLCRLLRDHMAWGLDAFVTIPNYEPPNVGSWYDWIGTEWWYESLSDTREMLDEELFEFCPNFSSNVSGQYFPPKDQLPDPSATN